MNFLKLIWGLLFRLFPCPATVGLRRIGNPGRKSPVLVTCNFHLTVARLEQALSGLDVWLVVAQSRGMNVWCSAISGYFSTHSVISALKTSGIDTLVDHRELILPPLAASGILAEDIHQETGWTPHWGPVRASDLPRYLSSRTSRKEYSRDEKMKRAGYGWRKRLDTGLGTMFPAYLLIAVCLLAYRPVWFLHYLYVGVLTFILFALLHPYLPGKTGITKAILPSILLAAALAVVSVPGLEPSASLRMDLMIAIVMFFVFGAELSGMSVTMHSDMAYSPGRLRVRSIDNFAFVEAARADLLEGRRRLTVNAETCNMCLACIELCPSGVWASGTYKTEAKGEAGIGKTAVLAHPDACVACCACLIQCGTGAIQALAIEDFSEILKA